MKLFLAKYTLFVLILALINFIVKGQFFSLSPFIIALQLAAVLLLVWARLTFGNQEFSIAAEPGSGPLIQRGPYKLMRHPMYTGGLLLVWSSVLGHWSLSNPLIALAVTVVVLLKIRLEEGLLRERYPDYTEYASRTKRLIPYIY